MLFQIWPRLVGNCYLNRPIGDQIQDSKLFTDVEIVKFNPRFTQFMMGVGTLISFEVYGWATK